tara:strand:- start:410 stop:565 length:156 start_codon:yes stop_codon:yes gene_type:complete
MRRRAKDPTHKITISIPWSILQAIEAEIGPEKSRSAFITQAIKELLDKSKD